MILQSHLGLVVKVKFLDHVLGRTDLIVCEAIGEVIEVDEMKVVLRFWKIEDKDESFCSENDEFFTLAISTIQHIDVFMLRPRMI